MGRKKPNKTTAAPRPKIKAVWFILLLLIVGFGAFFATRKSAPRPIEITGQVTYSKQIAPILFDNCATCHRAGGSGPFELLTYEDARKRAKDIARVTANRTMPPWQPEHGHGDFEGERRLTDLQIATIQKWVEQQALQGDRADLPPTPEFNNEWQLGKPDLVVQPGPYSLPAEGKDIYYNFVVPIPTTANKYVASVELVSGNRAVHHAFVNVDETRAARRLGEKNKPPGFPGMDTPDSTSMPGGQLLGWQPGKIPSLNPPGLAWILRTNTDLVLQAHMNPTGKPESVAPKLGFYFTEQPPTNTAFRIRLTSLQLDIPAGESNYVTKISYTVPVDVNLVRVGAHAHYLAKEIQGYAILPDGKKKWLLRIKDWDFKWQGDYKYKQPVFLPKGSKLEMRFTYDNSTNNIRNPFTPPRRTLWGLNTTDEMGELYFQTLARDSADYQKIAMDYTRYFARVSLDFYRFRAQLNPADAEMQQRLGRSLGSLGQMDEALVHLSEAIRLNPNDDKAYFDLGSIFLRQKRTTEAYAAFQNVIRLNPEDSQAFGSLGIISLQTGRLDEARAHFVAALRIDPEDRLASQYLQRLNAAPP
jgi:hypothetical protein